MSSFTAGIVVIPPWRDLLLRELKSAQREVLIASPYIKTPIARAVSVAAMRPEVSMRVVSRFKASDFAYGASDLEALWTLYKRNERSHGVRTDNILHAKVYIFDRTTAYVGSSNLTYSGLERNREICIKTTDPKLVERLAAEFDAIWNAGKLLHPADFGRMLADLQRGPDESISPSSEDRLNMPNQLEAAQEFVTTSLLGAEEELQPPSAFDSRAPELAQLAATPQTPASVDHVPNDAQGRIAAHREAKRIEEYFNVLTKRLNIDVSRNPYLFAAAVCEKSVRDFKVQPQTLSYGVELEKLFPRWFNQLTGLGTAMYVYGCASIAVRAGVAARFGAAAVSEFWRACMAQDVAGRQWTTNFLGPPVRHRAARSAKDAYQTAAYRLIGAVMASSGPTACLEFIDQFFNPLDELGTDVASILALRDVKTTLQEIAQAQSLKPIYEDYVPAGRDHKPEWRCRVIVGKEIDAHGVGATKAEAEFAGARAALDQMSQRKGWFTAMEQWRRSVLRRYQKDSRSVDKGPWTLGLAKSEKLIAALRSRSLEADPDLAYQALLGPEARHLAGGRDNLLLSHLGALFAQVCFRTLLFEANPNSDITPQHRGFFAALPKTLAVDDLLIEMGVPRENGSKPELDVAQALIAAVVMTEQEDLALSVFQRLLRPNMESSLDSAAAASGSPKEILGALPDEFDESISYATVLQGLTQAAFKSLPQYHFVSSGPQHAPAFHATVEIDAFRETGMESSKAKARNAAAFALLRRLKEDGFQ